MRVIIVDKEDEVIGEKDRSALTREDIYRVSALWATNSRGEILLARRAQDKIHDPGKWGPATSGSVSVGDGYYTSILKRAKEEIGLEHFACKRLHLFRRSHKYNYFCQWYKTAVDKRAEEFIIDKNEVEEVRWFSRPELLADIEKNPNKYLSAMGLYLEMFK